MAELPIHVLVKQRDPLFHGTRYMGPIYGIIVEISEGLTDVGRVVVCF